MNIDSNCLVSINGALLLGEIQSIFQYTVTVKIYGDNLSETHVVNKENVIGSISSKAFESIKEHYNVLVKTDLQ
ncbi:hypothetical protein [Viridibacillus arvi]|uniref:hypothetical protein n=1 Tax=Viridibacillus arvi TaxID=263475 RepID=UPI0034CFA271